MITNSDIDLMSKDELIAFIAKAQVEYHKYDKQQHSAKILLNSLYGAMGTPYFRFYNLYCAEGVTLTGQTCTAQSYDVFNSFQSDIMHDNKDRTVASDTDSAYIDLTELIYKLYKTTNLNDVLDKVVKLCDVVLTDKLTVRFDKFASDLNSMKNCIDMKREVIGEAVFVAKKNNVIMAYDNEGIRYATPHMKITGLEAIKSSTPKFFAEQLKFGYGLLFQDEEFKVHNFVDSVYGQVQQLTPDDVSGVSTANNIESFMSGETYKLGTPKHIKGAIAYNKLIAGSDLYKPIRSGEKVSIIQLKEPNPIRSPVLAYNEKYPADLLDEKYVDKDLDYNKYFIKPYKRVLDIVKWNTKHVPSLFDFYS